MNRPEAQGEMKGYLLLADISGFDAYLANVELEHAHDIMAELLELIVASLQPLLQIANIRADAVLAYAPEASISRGESLLELIEACYVAFRDRLRSITRNNTCGCRACTTVPSLDLKFLVHFGAFVPLPDRNGAMSLVSLDANLVTERLLKSQAVEGSRSYALFSEPSLLKLQIRPANMTEGSGTYPHLGEIRSASYDLSRRYEVLRSDARVYLTADESDFVVSHEFPAPLSEVWDWLNDPYKRTLWFRWTTWKAVLRPAGRTDVGAVNHCAHGIGTAIETILDWRPYDYFTVALAQDSIWYRILATYQLEPVADGKTRLDYRGRLERAPAMWLSKTMLNAFLSWKLKQDFQRMERLLSERNTRLAAMAPTEGSPDLQE
jgi:uncharacterized protein YndB with AHSA1/START domain